MLKRPITYTDFNDEKVTDVEYFNLSETELMDMEVEHEGGLKARLERLIETKDRKSQLDFFKDLILRSYGIKSDDGKRFEKGPELMLSFSQSAAYPALFMEVSTNEQAAADFLKGIIPKSLSVELEKAMLLDQTAEALGKPKDG